jgi:hypothetical protein
MPPCPSHTLQGSAKAILAKAATGANSSTAAAAVTEAGGGSSAAGGGSSTAGAATGAGSAGGHALGKVLSQKRQPVTVAPVAGGASPAATPTKKKKGFFAKIGRAFS